MGLVTAPVDQHYNLGPVKPWVQTAGDSLGTRFGIKTEYGWRQSDPFPDHPSGHAIDFMTPSMQVGDALKDYAIANRVSLGIKYIIWNRTYYGPENGYKGSPYTATNNPHTDHVHITFLDQPGTTTTTGSNDSGDVQQATLTASGDTCAISLPIPSLSGIDYKCVLSKSQMRAVVGAGLMFTGAGLLVVAGIIFAAYGFQKSGAMNLLGTLKRLV